MIEIPPSGEDITVFQARVLRKALEIWVKHKLRVNRAYTPKAMLATASRITGRDFKRGQYAQAIAALDAWIKRRE